MKRLFLSAGVALLAGAASAQDIHFTQYFASPLTLNPALTGLVPCDVRLAANYRTQNQTVSNNPYVTSTVSYDMATLKGKLNNGDALGVGVLGVFDRAGIGAYQNITVGLSVAYHKSLGQTDNHTVSLGVQGALVQKSINPAELTFEDQFDAGTGGTPYPTGETFANADLNYPDFNAGLMYTGRLSENSTAYLGFSTYHLTTPEETFLRRINNGQEIHQIHRRYTGYLGGSFKLNENVVLYASGLYQQQAKAYEILTGAAVGFVLNPGYDEEFQRQTVLYLGGWYRYADAVCPYVGLEMKKLTLGLSYDVTASSFSPATNGNGAYELTLTFNGCINERNRQPRYNFACPKF